MFYINYEKVQYTGVGEISTKQLSQKNLLNPKLQTAQKDGQSKCYFHIQQIRIYMYIASR